MASDFKIFVHRNDENVHFKLEGDFDESSAYEFLRAFKNSCRGASRAFVHTSSLSHVHPFGRDVLQRSLGMAYGKHIKLVYTGDKADQLAP
jgi:hypothetical protein